MIGIDTNILARYYVAGESDAEAARLVDSGAPLLVAKTVVLEFEWVLRGYDRLPAKEILKVLRHLLALPQVTVEDRETVVLALSHCAAGLDFAEPCTMPAAGAVTRWRPSTTGGSPAGCRRSA